MSSPEYTVTGNSDSKRSRNKDLESTLPHFFSRYTEDSYDEEDELSQATSAFQRSVISWLKSGKSYEELLDYVTKECNEGKTAYKKQVAKEKKRAAAAKEKEKALADSRDSLVRVLMGYLCLLGLIEKTDISDENKKKLIKIFKGFEEGLDKGSKFKFDPFFFNFNFDIDSPVGRRKLLNLWEDICNF